jgi:hypothetical protein
VVHAVAKIPTAEEKKYRTSMSVMGMLRQLTLRPYPKSHLCAVSPEINHLGTVCNCV